LPARMTIFCILSLRCFVRRDRPSDETRKRPSGDACTDALASARPPRPGVVRAGALRQHGPAPRGVAGGTRTGLGDQSVGGICLLKEAAERHSSRISVLVAIGQHAPNTATSQANGQTPLGTKPQHGTSRQAREGRVSRRMVPHRLLVNGLRVASVASGR